MCREPKCYAAIEGALRAAGSVQRAGDLYATRSIMSKAKTIFKGLQVCEGR
jgi:vacuolar protein sorting-associated protein 45